MENNNLTFKLIDAIYQSTLFHYTDDEEKFKNTIKKVYNNEGYDFIENEKPIFLYTEFEINFWVKKVCKYIRENKKQEITNLLRKILISCGNDDGPIDEIISYYISKESE